MSEANREAVLLVIDAGNTNTVFGIYRGEELVRQIRLSTARDRTADEYAALLMPLLADAGVAASDCEGVAISSVVPPLTPVFERVSRRLFGHRPVVVEPGVKTGLPIRYDNPAEVGADRICNALAARELFGAPAVVVDFGTALTFDIVDAEGAYIGGIIAPGPEIAAEALFSRGSRLSRVDLRRPPHVIGSTTATAMQSGLFYGFVGLVDGILERLLEELPGLEAIVATGGRADLVVGESRHLDQVHPFLTLHGLRRIWELNRPAEAPDRE